MRRGRPTNPFSAHRHGPGRVPYVFEEGDSLARTADAFERAGWTGELWGPHGSGKSTLLAALGEEMERRGLRLFRWQCRDDRPRLPPGWRWRLWRSDACLLDGAERLHEGQFRALRKACRRMGRGLVATRHEPCGLGLSLRITTSVRQFEALVARLRAGSAETGGAEDAAEALARRGGDAREALFDLYDSWEKRGDGAIVSGNR